MTALPITEPGIYAGIPMADYHRQLTSGPSTSSGGLRTIDAKSPAHYFAESYLNPDAEPTDTVALRMGKAAHSLLLGDEVFEDHFEVAPFKLGRNVNENADGEPADEGDDVVWRAGQKKDWWRGVERIGFIPLTQGELATLHAMREVLIREPLIQDGLLDGEAERSIVWRDEETGVWLKARPDVLPKAGWVVDYKTTADAHPRAAERDIWKRRYHMQLALVAEGMAALGFDVPREFALVFQEKTAPYAVTIQEVPAEAIWAGAKQNRAAIRTFAQCLSEGRWPAYGEGRPIQTPQFIIDKSAGIETPAWLKPLENAA